MIRQLLQTALSILVATSTAVVFAQDTHIDAVTHDRVFVQGADNRLWAAVFTPAPSDEQSATTQLLTRTTAGDFLVVDSLMTRPVWMAASPDGVWFGQADGRVWMHDGNAAAVRPRVPTLKAPAAVTVDNHGRLVVVLPGSVRVETELPDEPGDTAPDTSDAASQPESDSALDELSRIMPSLVANGPSSQPAAQTSTDTPVSPDAPQDGDMIDTSPAGKALAGSPWRLYTVRSARWQILTDVPEYVASDAKLALDCNEKGAMLLAWRAGSDDHLQYATYDGDWQQGQPITVQGVLHRWWVVSVDGQWRVVLGIAGQKPADTQLRLLSLPGDQQQVDVLLADDTGPLQGQTDTLAVGVWQNHLYAAYPGQDGHSYRLAGFDASGTVVEHSRDLAPAGWALTQHTIIMLDWIIFGLFILLLVLVFMYRRERLTQTLALPAPLREAPMWRRGFGFAMDLLTVTMIVMVFWSPVVMSLRDEYPGILSEMNPENMPDILRWLPVSILGAYVVYTLVFELLLGSTPGKMAVQLQIVSTDFTVPSRRQLVIRNLVRLLEVNINMLPFVLVVVLFTPNRQRLGDMAADTLVVFNPYRQLPGDIEKAARQQQQQQSTQAERDDQHSDSDSDTDQPRPDDEDSRHSRFTPRR